MDARTLRRLMPATFLDCVTPGLLGVVFGQGALDTWPVETPYGAVPTGHVTLPVARLMTGVLNVSGVSER